MNADRKIAPVIVMGCPRSGTNLLYDTLVSAGDFAIFRGRLPVYNVLVPRFGNLDRTENRAKLISAWVRTRGFQLTQVDQAVLRRRIMEECQSGGDFLRIVMEEVARKQSVARWVFYSPEMLTMMPILKREIPNALFLHIMRDGRDVALSLQKLGGFNPLPWNRNTERTLEATAHYWQWLVQKGRKYGRDMPADYMEVHFETLLEDPKRLLLAVGDFLHHKLDLDQIRNSGLGTLQHANSSFREEPFERALNPVQRWKRRLSEKEVARLEWHIGATLQELGYVRASLESSWQPDAKDRWFSLTYPALFESKLWMKRKTLLGRLAKSAELELRGAPAPEMRSSQAQSE